MNRRPRHLSAEERALWDQVAGRTQPIKKPRAVPKSMQPRPKKVQPPEQARAIEPFRVGQNVDHHGTHDLLPSLSAQLAGAPVAMDRKSFGKLKRGKLRPEGRIDLHGMTLDQAHPALVSFILSSHAAGKRLVLVITGKGKDRDDGGPIPTRMGVLRHQVPQWLRVGPLAGAVLQVSEAHLKHGGHGAFYVYLRRHR
ncbi:DNA mismatch repair protein MutS [Octadecabacter sp. SW4]|uniref:Smr/MutS family protein n=1 Tax=Octadecabacter sp. SW4 TaxID=2602067 RepID=UPI0011C1E301|nr:Smr/MutS family protein [Octadecabacter sp. SW4]QEE37105.1 DNA mismatch repair protein MutS [Octadecabacter sp. SW4]